MSFGRAAVAGCMDAACHGATAARALALGLVALLAGCAAPEPEPTFDVPTLEEIAPSPGSRVVEPAPQMTHRPTHRLLIKRIAFARDDARVDLVLDALEPAGLDGELLETWRANGFDVRRVPMDRLEMVLANMPRPVEARTIACQAGPNYAPMTLVGRLPAMSRVRSVDEPGAGPHVQRLYGGEHRLMMRLGEGDIRKDDPEPTVDLFPHHYGPRQTLLPRTPSQKLLDGTAFDQLRINQPIPEQTVWAIWCPLHLQDEAAPDNEPDQPLDDGPDEGSPDEKDQPQVVAARPLFEGEDGAETSDGDRTPATETKTGASAQSQTGEAPPLLGRAMMTGRQGRREVRLVLLLTVKPIEGAATMEAEPRGGPAEADTDAQADGPDDAAEADGER